MTVEYVYIHSPARLLAGQKTKRLIRPEVLRHMRATNVGTSGKFRLDGAYRNPRYIPMPKRLRALLTADIAPEVQRLSHLSGKDLARCYRSATP